MCRFNLGPLILRSNSAWVLSQFHISMVQSQKKVYFFLMLPHKEVSWCQLCVVFFQGGGGGRQGQWRRDNSQVRALHPARPVSGHGSRQASPHHQPQSRLQELWDHLGKVWESDVSSQVLHIFIQTNIWSLTRYLDGFNWIDALNCFFVGQPMGWRSHWPTLPDPFLSTVATSTSWWERPTESWRTTRSNSKHMKLKWRDCSNWEEKQAPPLP